MKELQPLIDQLTEIVKGTKDFTINQAPDFVKQFLVMSSINCIGDLILCICIQSAIIWAFKWVWTHEFDDDQNECFVKGVLGLAGTFGAVASITFMIKNISDLAAIHFAPKAYIVRHLVDAFTQS